MTQVATHAKRRQLFGIVEDPAVGQNTGVVRCFLPTLLILLSSGCDSEPTTGHAPYWRVESAAGSSLLLGTIHGGIDADELPASLWQELETARVVITETDTRSIQSGDFMRAVSLPPGESIQAHTTTDEWVTILGSELAALYPGPTMNRLQPWFLQGALVSSLIPAQPPIDEVVMARARDAGLTLLFLEGWREQVELLNGLGIEDGLEQLLAVAEDEELARDILDDWFTAYRAGDGRWLTDLTLHPDDVLHRPRYYHEIVFERNRNWLPTLEPELDQGGAFIAVGFVHMFSDSGLVALLRERGYRISKVPPP